MSDLAVLLDRLQTETTLEALEGYNGPENPIVKRVMRNARKHVESRVQARNKELQLAKDLVDGKIQPADLVTTRRLDWKDGEYVLAEEEAAE